MSETKLKSVRDGFGEALLQIGEENKNIVVLTANLGESTRAHLFAEKFPDRFFDIGVAEQSLVTVASGMANYGKIPFITSYAVFSPGRTFEQIKVTVALNDVPVKIVGAHAGFGAGPYGATHESLEDISLMRVIPNMIVVVPCDFEEAKKATIAVSSNSKPSYLRLARQDSQVITKSDSNFEIGKAEILHESKNPQVTIIGCGPVLGEALMAARELSKSEIEVEVVNCHTIKPIDARTIISSAKKSGAVVTIEEHQVNGGMGSAVAEVLAQNFPVPIEIMGVKDEFGESGDPNELLIKHHLMARDIADSVKKVIARKNN